MIKFKNNLFFILLTMLSLYYAINCKNRKMVERLLREGIHPDNTVKGFYRPLVKSILLTDVDLVSILLQNGANPNNINDETVSPLAIAIKVNSPAIVSLLLNYNADTSIFPLYVNSVIMSILISHGININILDRECRSFLHYAAKNDDVDTVISLILHGAEVNVQDSKGLCPLHHAVSKRTTLTAKVLLENGANVNTKDSLGRLPLHLGSNTYEMVKLLTDYGSSIDTKDVNGATPLHYAIWKTSLDTIRLLINDFTINALDNKGNSPLHCIILSETEIVIELLLRGADITIKDMCGNTPLDILCKLRIKKLDNMKAIIANAFLMKEVVPDLLVSCGFESNKEIITNIKSLKQYEISCIKEIDIMKERSFKKNGISVLDVCTGKLHYLHRLVYAYDNIEDNIEYNDFPIYCKYIKSRIEKAIYKETIIKKTIILLDDILIKHDYASWHDLPYEIKYYIIEHINVYLIKLLLHIQI
ncbi:ankyrin repeat protein [Penguinpox virus]|uniref:Ankyrin repeat protein n=1 Tax=Penguinpox virus TaxID=648998 RepID=A0A068EFK4_9POXV|nr:ankyrin repeat protein [Penguinpox virus]AID46956.1 ankyrin repeat protein [Penguinpox virus]